MKAVKCRMETIFDTALFLSGTILFAAAVAIITYSWAMMVADKVNKKRGK